MGDAFMTTTPSWQSRDLAFGLNDPQPSLTAAGLAHELRTIASASHDGFQSIANPAATRPATNPIAEAPTATIHRLPDASPNLLPPDNLFERVVS
jgi:hypothetical protein